MFRDASCIELYESGLALTTKDSSYSTSYLAGRPEYSTRPAFKIPLIDIHVLAGHLGVTVDNLERYIPASAYSHQSSEHDVQFRGGPSKPGQEARSYEINLNRHLESPADDMTDVHIARLEVDAGPNFAQIRLTYRLGEETKEVVQEITYSGPYAVWWA